MSSDQSQIFISYRRDDSAGHAGRLADDLGEFFGEDTVFLDVDAVSPGQDFVEAIRDAIAQSAAVLPVIGPRWASLLRAESGGQGDASDWVRVEIAEALSQKRPLIPVLVQGARMPTRSELPNDLERFSRFNALEVTDTRWDYDVGRLVEALERVGATPAEAPSAFPDEGPRGRAELREAWLVRGGLPVVRERVSTFARSHGQKPGTWAANVLELRSGSKLSTRVLGGFFVRQGTLPTAAKIRLTRRGLQTLVEALIWEQFGAGVFTGMEGRYEALFDKWMRELRSATEADGG